MNIKKAITLIMVISILVLSVGCSKEDSKKWESFTEPLGEELVSKVPFDDELAPVEMNLISPMYGIDDAGLKDYKVYMSSGGTADEIAIFFTDSNKKAKELETSVKKHIEDQKVIMRDYLPDEIAKLENAVVHVEGPYVVLCVSGDSEKAKKIIDSYFNK